MQKMLVGVAVAALAVSGLGFAKDASLVSIDSIAIMQKSAEGKVLAEKIKKEIDKFQEDVKGAQKDLADQQEALGKQAKVLSTEAMQEKQEDLAKKRKNLEREFADKEEALRVNIQKQQITLRDKQLKVINEILENEADKSALLFDKNTPGLLACKGTDETDKYLEAIDKKYQASNSKSAPVKAATKEKVKSSIKAA